MSDRLKTLWIGVFIIAAIIAVASLLLFLEPTVGDEGKTLRVRFSNIEKISIGTRVTFAGKPVGEVVQINEIFDARNQPSDSVGNIYFYELVLKVDSSVDVYNTDLIIFQTSGLLGEKSIAIIPKAPKPGSPPAHIVNDEVLYARSTDKMEEAINEVVAIADKLEQGMDRIINFIDSNSAEISSTIKSIHKTSDEMGTFLAKTNDNEIPAAIRKAADNFSQTMDQTRQVISDVQQTELVERLSDMLYNVKCITGALNQPEVLAEILEKVREATCCICKVFGDLSSGQGTLGRLITSDELYLRLNSAFSGVEGLLADIKTYGLLYNYNKRWQRSQNRQQQLVDCLNTADNFDQYFNSEITDIIERLNQVSCILQNNGGRDASCNDPKFLTEFYSLMKKVNEMQATLKLYNQAIVQQCE